MNKFLGESLPLKETVISKRLLYAPPGLFAIFRDNEGKEFKEKVVFVVAIREKWHDFKGEEHEGFSFDYVCGGDVAEGFGSASEMDNFVRAEYSEGKV